MSLYKFENNTFSRVEKTTFQKEQILERQHIQQALKKNIDIISYDLLVISEEFSEWSDSARRIDLLAVDTAGNIVVIELKRTEKGEEMDIQALRYAAMVSTLTLSRAIEIYSTDIEKNNFEIDAKLSLLEHLNSQSEEDFANDVKVVLVSKDFGKELTTCVMWLNERDLDITCIRMVPYKKDEEILVDFQQIIPLPEAEAYQVQIKAQKEERRISHQQSNKKNKYTYIIDDREYTGLRDLVRSEWALYINTHSYLSEEKIFSAFNSSWFSTKEKSIETSERTGHPPRNFIENNEVLSINDKNIVITNQWTHTGIQTFMKCLEKLGHKIEIIEHNRD